MERAPLKRRLTAVLLADVAGYSRLMSRDEEDTHLRLSLLVTELFEPKTAQYGGRMIRSMGDGLLVEFDSAHDAVRCGLEVQRGLVEYNDAIGIPLRIHLRIGINTGDVICDDGYIYGNSVNIAARLEELAEPGAVYVSSGVHDQLRGHPNLSFADHGHRWLKNIDHPVRVFRVEETQEPQPTPLPSILRSTRRLLLPIGLRRSLAQYFFALGVIIAGTLGLTTFPIWHGYWPSWQRASILVLPFRNLSGDPGQDYFADAVTDNLTTDLSRMRHVRVISSATAFTFKGKPLDARQIGREIGVRYLLEGSVRRVGGQVETNAQLIDAGSGTQLWADHFENKFADLIALEAAITGRIANSLNMQLISAESRRMAEVANPGALDLRLRAEGLFFSAITPEHTLAAQRLLERSVRLDPNSAEAWAWLADLMSSQYLSHWNGAGPKQLVEAEDAVQRALALDPNLALAHFTNGFIHHARGEHRAALDSFSQAIALDPNYARAYAQKGNELIQVGQPDEAPVLVEKAIKLSPRDPLLGEFYWVLGRAYFYMGRYNQAIPWLRKSVEIRSNVWYNQLHLASAHALCGEAKEAEKILQDFRRHFAGRKYTAAVIQSYEHANPNDNAVVVAARAKFHKGLLQAGMAAQ
jgi:adenylate cyclase